MAQLDGHLTGDQEVLSLIPARLATLRFDHGIFSTVILSLLLGVVGCGEGVVYLMSPGHPTDIGLQLGKACYPFSSKGRGGMFL